MNALLIKKMEYKIEHIGYLTISIETTVAVFKSLGYSQVGCVINDDTQKTTICFIHKAGETPIELVQPYEDNRTMQRMLSKHGNGPYHLCYGVDDIQTADDTMVKDDWLPLFCPVAAPALGNRLICYFFKEEVGFIELVNNK